MRPGIPGEDDPFLGVRDGIPGSTITGTIQAVNTRNGTVDLRVGSSVGARNEIKIPCFQLSFNGTKSSRFRFMPQVGDRVVLAQDVSGDTHILSYECLNYQQLADANEADEFLFRELKEGEFEIWSSGMASIFGSERGELRLAGGPCTVILNRQTLEVEYDSPLHKMLAVGCELRFGEVRRKLLPTDFEETALAQGVQREFRVTVARSVGAVDTKLVDVALGDVVDDTSPFAPTLSGGAAPVRVQVRVFDDAGVTEMFRFRVDNTGNVEWTQAQTATAVGAKLVALGSLLNLQFRDMVLQPSLTWRLGSDSAAENLVLGVQLNTFLQALMDALNSAVIATPMGPASFNPATLAAFQALKGTYLTSNLILSDFAFTQKVPTPGSG